MNTLKRKYFRRFFLTLFVAFLLAYFPHYQWFVRFLCLILFGMLAAWTDRAQCEMQRKDHLDIV
jgi:hypothetical protein